MNIIITESQMNKLKSDWKVVKGKLCKKFEFDSYKDVLDFVNKVGEIAEEQNHHPDMIVKYNEVIVTMFDHDKNKISDRCYKFTNAVDEMMMDSEEEIDERSRSFAFTRKKRLFPKSAMMSNPNRFKKYDKEVKGLD
jgi:4a-hydroxytetrahydrobiopterin dehydratase